ncbi:MAG: hypothetical protein DRI75_01935 [Bacteroidetes bacterium]|nr:MAG: hypothetical protein DRI75_01935 [Bacteroidota bacterium]
MNKLVIVGNGFDLAHGLPTSYNDFIDDFWKCLKENYEKEEIKLVVDINPSYYRFFDYNPIGNYKDIVKNLKEYSKEYDYFYDEKNNVCFTARGRSIPIFKFENDFFKQININESINDWVDIENEYYKKLKRIVKSESLTIPRDEEQWLRKQKEEVRKLNKEFEQVKNLLENYLYEKIDGKYDFKTLPTNSHELTNYFSIKPKYLEKTPNRTNYLMEFPNEDRLELIKNDNELIEAEKNNKLTKAVMSDFFSADSLFLNFNYTSSIEPYLNLFNKSDFSKTYGRCFELKIHGTIKDPDNLINFGFGDEMDDDYKKIENIGENEYLRNFKSFKYLDNMNYKNLLNFIETKKFQVYILGHSCGLSDRTLLNTIFEHNNCRSIKIFYHLKDDGTDNFTDIVQNISRHFKNKETMRKKIVNKKLSIPLPQNSEFVKRN